MSETPDTPFSEFDKQPKTMGEGVSWVKILLFAGLAFVAITGLTLGVFGFMVWTFIDSQEKDYFAHVKPKTYVEEVARDLDAVREDPFFQGVVKAEALEAPELNAGLELNRMLTWTLPEDRSGSPPVAGGLELPSELMDQIDDWGIDWAEHAGDVDAKALDFSWMSGLRKYQYWTLDVESPLGDALQRNPELDPYFFPTPDYRALSVWVKLRLLSALKAPDPTASLEDVRHVAHLTLTTPSLVAEMTGLMYLQQLNRIAVTLGRPASPSIETTDQARRSFFGLIGYLEFGIPGNTFERVFPQGKIHPGACAAMNEKIGAAAMNRETLAPSYPEEFQAFESRLAELRKGCASSAALKHYDLKLTPATLTMPLAEALSGVEQAGPAFGDGAEWNAVKHIPPMRKAIGLILANLGRADGLSAYDGSENQPELPVDAAEVPADAELIPDADPEAGAEPPPSDP